MQLVKVFDRRVLFITYSQVFKISTSTSGNKIKQDDVDFIINENAVSRILSSNVISHFHSNQLGVNRPIEDRWNANYIDLSDYREKKHESPTLGHTFAVVDGHSGHACAHAINFLHPNYVTASMIENPEILQEYLSNLNENQFFALNRSFVPNISWDSLATSIREVHIKNIQKYVTELISTRFGIDEFCKKSALLESLSRLDYDMIHAAKPTNDCINLPLLRSVTSGAVGSFAYIPENEEKIYLAQVGDCGAVLGSRDPDSNEWKAELLIEPHTSQNIQEVERIQNCHPISENHALLLEGRLLGELMPLRAFGDIRFKWDKSHLRKAASILNLSPSYQVTPRYYKTPPYLISLPEVREIEIDRSRDRFLILATDGIWDFLSPLDAVSAVGAWQDSDEYKNLEGQNQYSGGYNVGSLLIKTALGGPTMNRKEIYSKLSVPANVGRYHRDDMTVIVIFIKES